MGVEEQRCGHEPCENKLPAGTKIPPGWTLAIVEEYKKESIVTYHLCLCPAHTLTTVAKQTTLFGDAPT